jgi:peptidyl-prolyl cis-trans isomerase SurA
VPNLRSTRVASISEARPKPRFAAVSPRLLAACALLSLSLAGCKKAPSPDVVATVNGHPIMRADLDKAYQNQLGDTPPQEPPSQEQADSLRLGLLRNLIDEEIIDQRAAKMNLTATPAEVDAKLAEMKAPFPTEEQFQQRLAQNHTTVDEIKRDLRRSLTQNKLLNKEINSKITISDADISAYFNSHKAEFDNKFPLYHLAQILVTNTPPPENSGPVNLQGSKATSDDEARKKIQALKNRIDSGEDFGTLAMNFSENAQNSSNGGDMGVIQEPDLQRTVGPVLFAALDNLKPGQTTSIIPLPDPNDPHKIVGYMILQLISKEPAGQHTLAEPQIQQRIRQGLHDARSQLLKAAYFEMLRDQSKVENYFAEQIFKADAH